MELLKNGKENVYIRKILREMEDGSLIAWKGDGGDLSEILPDWFMKISVKFLSELSALLKREKFGALIKLSTRDNKHFRTTRFSCSYFYPRGSVLKGWF